MIVGAKLVYRGVGSWFIPALAFWDTWEGRQGWGGRVYVTCSVVSSSLQSPGLYLLGSSVHGILQARQEYVAISFYTRGSVVVAKELHQLRIFNSWWLFFTTQTDIEITREEDFTRILQMEEEYIQQLCEDIIQLKPDVVITEKGISGRTPFIFPACCCGRRGWVAFFIPCCHVLNIIYGDG